MTTYDETFRQQAVDLAVTEGTNEAARQLGIGQATVSRWVRAAGLGTFHSERTAAATEARRLEWEQRRVELAHEQGRVAAKALAKAEAAMDDDTAGKAKDYALTMAILVDKAQLLTGAATSRTESGPIDAAKAAELRDKARHLHAA